MTNITPILALLQRLEGETGQLTTAVMFGCDDVTDHARRVASVARRVAALVEECGTDCDDRNTRAHSDRRLSN